MISLLTDRQKRAVYRLEPIQRELIRMTLTCRVDMHEPDEQGIEAVVVGTHLDNAIGTDFGPTQWFENTAELMVGITRTSEDDTRAWRETRWFNLADLIALARLADLELED